MRSTARLSPLNVSGAYLSVSSSCPSRSETSPSVSSSSSSASFISSSSLSLSAVPGSSSSASSTSFVSSPCIRTSLSLSSAPSLSRSKIKLSSKTSSSSSSSSLSSISSSSSLFSSTSTKSFLTLLVILLTILSTTLAAPIQDSSSSTNNTFTYSGRFPSSAKRPENEMGHERSRVWNPGSLHESSRHIHPPSKENIEPEGAPISTDWKELPQGDMPMRDQPPRSIPAKNTPNAWVKPSQGRIYFLASQGDQYLQVHDGKVTGTYDERPAYGIVQFFSHNMNVLIKGYLVDKFICRNNRGEIYLQEEVTSDCFFREVPADGSHNMLLEFRSDHVIKDGTRSFLRVECAGKSSTRLDKHAHFTYDHTITESEARKIKQNIHQYQPGEQCQTTYEMLREKYEARWCRNFNRVMKYPDNYKNNCKKKHAKSCDTSKVSSERECVCDILDGMLASPHEAKKDCLKTKMDAKIVKEGLVSNQRKLDILAESLVKYYAHIARRFRYVHQSHKPDRGTSVVSTTQGRKRKRPMFQLSKLIHKFRFELSEASQPSGTEVTLSDKLVHEVSNMTSRLHRIRRKKKKASRRGKKRRGRKRRRKNRRKGAKGQKIKDRESKASSQVPSTGE